MTYESFRPQLTNDNAQQAPSNLQNESIQLMGDRGGRATQQKSEPSELVFDSKIWSNDSNQLATKVKNESGNSDATKAEQKQGELKEAGDKNRIDVKQKLDENVSSKDSQKHEGTPKDDNASNVVKNKIGEKSKSDTSDSDVSKEKDKSKTDGGVKDKTGDKLDSKDKREEKEQDDVVKDKIGEQSKTDNATIVDKEKVENSTKDKTGESATEATKAKTHDGRLDRDKTIEDIKPTDPKKAPRGDETSTEKANPPGAHRPKTDCFPNRTATGSSDPSEQRQRNPRDQRGGFGQGARHDHQQVEQVTGGRKR
ncbi:MAG: hypothetical protein SGJ27_05600 [Candidatus Melainabacteria bacterium]|nr:hypothetical protein [Candidatus Melainabacteria bacterium]